MVNGFNKKQLLKDTAVEDVTPAAPAPSPIASTKPAPDAPLLAGAVEDETPKKASLNSIANAYKKAMLA